MLPLHIKGETTDGSWEGSNEKAARLCHNIKYTWWELSFTGENCVRVYFMCI